jgi:hypothetical protein
VNGVTQYMVGAGNKNGKYYAFIRGNISAGPVWTDTLGTSGNCPQCGAGIIASSGWDGSKVYVAGGNTTINSTSCVGYVRALDPATGAIVWEDCFSDVTTDGPVLGGVIAVPGVVVVGEGTNVKLISTDTGRILNSLTDPHDINSSRYFSVASISNGVLYIGNMDWYLYSYGL